MIAVRGAVTVLKDEREEISSATKKMLRIILEKNNIEMSEVICVMFSTTKDITSFYPAAAAREIGFTDCALYSSAEPDIEGSLKLCIRVMLLADKIKDKQDIKHVYLGEAKKLRRDLCDD